MDQHGGVREEAASLLLRLSSQQQQQKAPEHELLQPGLSAATAPPTVVQLDEDDENETAEKRKLSINFLLNTPATPVVGGGKSRATSAPPSPTAPASPLASSAATTWRPSSPPLPVLQPLPSPLLPPAFPTAFSSLSSSSSSITTPPSTTLTSSSSSSSSPSSPVYPHAVLEAGGLGGLPNGLLHPPGLARPAAPVDDEEVLRQRREKHVQRQRELLLQLLQEKRLMGQTNPTPGSHSNSDDDLNSHINYVSGNPVEKRQRKPSLGKTVTRRRGPTAVSWMDLDDGLDGMSDGLRLPHQEARPTEWHPRGGRGPSYIDLEQSPNDPTSFHTRGDWQTSRVARSHRATQPPANGHQSAHPRYTPSNNVHNSGASSRHHYPPQPQQGLSVVSQGGSLNELDEDDEGTSPPELVRLYGGSNQRQHPYLDDLARRRRRHSARPSPPTSSSECVAASNVASHHMAKPPSPQLPPPRTRRIYEELDDEGDVDGEWPDVGDTAQYRSSMPPVPAHVRRSAGSLLSPSSSSSSSSFSSDGYGFTAGDGTNGSSDGFGSRHGSLTSGLGGGSNGDVGSGLEDGTRKRASPAQMQMLQQILSTLEQCPQKLQEIERSAVVPTRRRKRRNEALSNGGSTSSAATSASSSSAGPSPTSPAAVEPTTTPSGQVAAADQTVAPREGDGLEGGSDESGSSGGSSRKRRRRDREVLIFHHMKVQEDGKMMVSQRS